MPPKATWLRFETDGDFAFSFYLAEKLGKTVDEIDRMPALHFMQWAVWFGRKAQQRELANRGG